MYPKNTSVYVSRPLGDAVDARHSGRPGAEFGATVGQIVGRYLALCASPPRLSGAEWRAVFDVLNGVLFDPPEMIRYLPQEVADALADGLAEKWQVDGAGLVAKLSAASLGELMAVADASWVFWSAVGRGEEPPIPGEPATGRAQYATRR